jgi:hypothetical protein
VVAVPDSVLGFELAELDALMELAVINGNSRLGTSFLRVFALYINKYYLNKKPRAGEANFLKQKKNSSK